MKRFLSLAPLLWFLPLLAALALALPAGAAESSARNADLLKAAPRTVPPVPVPEPVVGPSPKRQLPRPVSAKPDDFGPPPERVQTLLLETMRHVEAGDRDGSLLRLREIAKIVAAEGRGATIDGARELRNVLADVDRVSSRVHRGIKVTPADLLGLAGDVQEGLAYHYARRAEYLDRRALDTEAAYAKRLSRIAANHAARFLAQPSRRVDQQLSDAGESLLKNTGNGLANVFRGVSSTVERLGRNARDSARPERKKPAADPWR